MEYDDKEKSVEDELLWWTFKDNFIHWTEKHFAATKRSMLTKLRVRLRQGGIWVEMDKKKATMAMALTQIVEAEEGEERRWTIAEVLQLERERIGIRSPCLKYRLQYYKENGKDCWDGFF